MEFTVNYSRLLSGDGQLGPFPMHRLKRVERPTNLVTDDGQRVDARNMAFAKAVCGDYGSAVQKEMLRWFGGKKEPICASLEQVLFHLTANQPGEMAASKAPVPEDTAVVSRHIKSLGYFLEADSMGICRLPKTAVYTHDSEGKPVDIDYEFAIVIAVSKDYRTVKASGGFDWVVDAISYHSYQRSALIAQGIAGYIRKLGYPALVEHGSRRYDVLIPPLLLWAGMGEVSRCGIILNPFLGMSFKAAAVLTNLTLVPDKPIDFGLQDFCQHCKMCAEACPSQAIPTGDKVMYNGYETWKLDEQRCASFFILNQKGSGCGTCIKVCPWTRPNTWPHNLVRWAVRHSGLARRIAVKADAKRSYPKSHGGEKWWFDFEEIDGILRIPPQHTEGRGES